MFPTFQSCLDHIVNIKRDILKTIRLLAICLPLTQRMSVTHKIICYPFFLYVQVIKNMYLLNHTQPGPLV